MSYSELIKVGNSYNMPQKEFYCETLTEMNALPQTIPAGSTCTISDGNGG